MSKAKRLVFALLCALWTAYAAVRLVLVAADTIHLDSVSLTLTVISGIFGLVGLGAFAAGARSRS